MPFNFKRANSTYKNIWSDQNGMFKCPQIVEMANLTALKGVDCSTEEPLELLQSTQHFWHTPAALGS